MPLTRISPDQIGQADLTPQAVIGLSVADFHDRFGLVFDKGQDDFDTYEAVFFKLDGAIVALIHYRGERKGTVSVYLRNGLGPRDAQRAVDGILAEYSLPGDVVTWRQSPAPPAT